jgi:hypothetical protein
MTYEIQPELSELKVQRQSFQCLVSGQTLVGVGTLVMEIIPFHSLPEAEAFPEYLGRRGS